MPFFKFQVKPCKKSFSFWCCLVKFKHIIKEKVFCLSRTFTGPLGTSYGVKPYFISDKRLLKMLKMLHISYKPKLFKYSFSHSKTIFSEFCLVPRLVVNKVSLVHWSLTHVQYPYAEIIWRHAMLYNIFSTRPCFWICYGWWTIRKWYWCCNYILRTLNSLRFYHRSNRYHVSCFSSFCLFVPAPQH